MRVPLAQGYHLGRPAPTWRALDPEVALRRVSLGRDHGSATLRSHLEWAPTCTDTDDAEPALASDGVEVVAVLVCTDNAGRYVGVVRMERVLDRLAVGLRASRAAGAHPAA